MQITQIFTWASIFLLTLTLIPPVQACGCDGGNGVILPAPLSQTSAAYLYGKIYIFGGLTLGGMLDTVMAYDLDENCVTNLSVHLPFPLSNSIAIPYNGSVFIFGGTQSGNSSYNRNLTIFTPPEKITNFVNFFSYGLEGNSFAFDGKYFYFFGNCLEDDEGHSNIIRFDPDALTYDIYTDALPTKIAGSGAIWYKGAAYIFGGKTTGGKLLDTILKYTPGKPIVTLKTHLPYAVSNFAIVLKGDSVFMLGGMTSIGFSGEVLEFDLRTSEVKYSIVTLRKPKAVRAGVLIGNTSYIIGGDTKDGPAVGIEAVDLPHPPIKEKNSERYDQGNTVLVLSIIGSLIMILIVIIVYSREPRKR